VTLRFAFSSRAVSLRFLALCRFPPQPLIRDLSFYCLQGICFQILFLCWDHSLPTPPTSSLGSPYFSVCFPVKLFCGKSLFHFPPINGKGGYPELVFCIPLFFCPILFFPNSHSWTLTPFFFFCSPLAQSRAQLQPPPPTARS